jgi:hypothetical protein
MSSVAATPLDPGLRACFLRQLDISWALASYHLQGLSTDECLWRPSTKGLHVHHQADGSFSSDWPDHEGYDDLGPPSIAWLTWHIGFWWSMALDHSFGTAELTREQVLWPGSADAARAWIERTVSVAAAVTGSSRIVSR